MMLKALRLRALRFGTDTSGSMAVETVLIFPLLLWFYLSTFTYFDAYRGQATNIKSAYSIGDAMSRELNGVDAKYLTTMHQMLSFLNNTSHNTRLRVTVITRDENDKLQLIWSCTRGNGGASFKPFTDASLQTMDPLIPPSPQPDELIVVETFVDYAPPFSARLFDNETPDGGMIRQGNPEGFLIGLTPTTFSNLVVTRPRSVNQVKLKDDKCT